ncbi:beta-lactamase/transpeptidase-like protein [Whalleya microplaca]|nr:beta-lactamase/transpeptidase-like protein [Whalleya microplaca]
MYRSRNILTLAPIWLPSVFARFLGRMDPAPVDLTSDQSLVRESWENITSTFEGHLSGKSPLPVLSGLENVTFSLGMFSTHDSEAAGHLQYHYTSPDIANSSQGVNKVDGDSIYRIASLSKLITVLAGLIELDPADWNRPLSEIFPEIAKLPGDDPIRNIGWNQITALTLGSQISGVPRDAAPFLPNEIYYQLTQEVPPVDPASIGLPPPSPNNNSAINVPCQDQYCTAVQYIKGQQSPTFLPWQSPGYADTNFILLGRVISQLTNLTIEEFYHKAVFDPLAMTRSTSKSPTEKGYSGYVVAGDLSAFAFDGGITSSSGGVFSTTNDLAKLGVGILNSTLLPADQTRKWMKPNSFTSHLEFAMGNGWEIYRYTHKDTGAVTDMYTKLGDSGNYASYLVLVPDYDIGFSVIQASNMAAAQRSHAVQLLADLISETMLPALQAQAAAEAKCNFAGTYWSAPADNQTASSMTLVYNETAGTGTGLTISSFTNNGHDIIALLTQYYGSSQLMLQSAIPDSGNHRVSFQITAAIPESAWDSSTGLFSKQWYTNSDWISNNAATYGAVGIGTIWFDLSPQGKATAVTVPFLRKTFSRRERA